MGVRKQLSEMAEKNAADYLEKTVDKIRHKEDRTVLACRRLQEALRLSRYPRRMECYDISHISGVDKVGSMVVFADGEPERDSYRRFKIRTVEGSNDFACLQEVLKRRLGKLGTEEEERFPRPDLIVIDGGRDSSLRSRRSSTEWVWRESTSYPSPSAKKRCLRSFPANPSVSITATMRCRYCSDCATRPTVLRSRITGRCAGSALSLPCSTGSRGSAGSAGWR